MDLSKTIIPKSDQLNADDLISGPKTIKIRDVKAEADLKIPRQEIYKQLKNKVEIIDFKYL